MLVVMIFITCYAVFAMPVVFVYPIDVTRDILSSWHTAGVIRFLVGHCINIIMLSVIIVSYYYLLRILAYMIKSCKVIVYDIIKSCKGIDLFRITELSYRLSYLWSPDLYSHPGIPVIIGVLCYMVYTIYKVLKGLIGI
jgi:hypothetical protein